MNTEQKKDVGQKARIMLGNGHHLSDMVYIIYLSDSNKNCEKSVLGLSDPVCEHDYKRLQTPITYHRLGDLAQLW